MPSMQSKSYLNIAHLVRLLKVLQEHLTCWPESLFSIAVEVYEMEEKVNKRRLLTGLSTGKPFLIASSTSAVVCNALR